MLGLVLISSCARTDPTLFPVERDGKWGYIDRSGIVVIPAQFDAAFHFAEGLARVRRGDTTGFIDRHGTVIFTAPYEVVGDFSEGLAVVSNGERRDPHIGLVIEPGHWGYVDHAGHLVLLLRFSHADAFSEGLAAVQTASWSGFIDRQGDSVFAFPFQVSWGFHQGRALVRSPEGTVFLDRSGRILSAPAIDDYQAHSFTEGLAAVSVRGQWGYIDTSGAVRIAPRYLDGVEFSEGLAAVKDTIDPRRQQRCVLPGDSLSSYVATLGYGFIDHTGRILIPPQYESAGPFHDGVAAVATCGRTSYITAAGDTIFRTDFGTGAPFSHGLALLLDGGPGGRVRWVDRTGKAVWQSPVP